MDIMQTAGERWEAMQAVVDAAKEWSDARAQCLELPVTAASYDRLARAEAALQTATQAIVATETTQAATAAERAAEWRQRAPNGFWACPL